MVTRERLEAWLNDYMNVGGVQDSLPNGLQVEGKERIEKVLTAVSVSYEVIGRAVSERADAIVVHHGMFWKHDDPTLRGFRRKRVRSLLENDINLFAYHLPLDLHPEISNNRLILTCLGAENIEDCSRIHKDFAYGLRGTFPAPVAFTQLVERIDIVLKTKARAFKHGRDEVRSLFVVSGAGRSLTDRVPLLEVDAYLTGDAQESTGYIVMEEGLNYIYAGHYNTEKVGIEELGRKIAGAFEVDVRFFETENSL